jgi:hypothetical protein
MLIEEVLDDKERAKKELTCAMYATTETDKINKKNVGAIDSYYPL